MVYVDQCPLCHCSETTEQFTGRDRLHGREGVFHLMRCNCCGLFFLNPRPGPEEIDYYYPEGYISYPTAIEDEKSSLRRFDRAYGLHKRCREVIKRAGASGRILDVGCATGIFLHGMQQRGWEAYGVEPVSHAVQYARDRFHLTITEGILENSHFESDFFDAVTFWDVLEHVPNPVQTLEEVHRILKPGGWLVVTLPNPDAYEQAWFKEYWAGWDIPRHFHIFSQPVLKKLLDQTGFHTVEATSFTGNHGALIISLEFWMTDWNAPFSAKRLISRAVSSIPARLLTYPFYRVADRINKSSYMTVFARNCTNRPEHSYS